MKTTKIHLADQSFESQHSGTCNLLMRISPKRLSYAIVDQSNKQLKVLFDSSIENVQNGLDEIIDVDPFLKADFNKTRISVESPKFTFIPKDIYSDTDLESYAFFLNATDQSDILVKEIRSAKVQNIISLDKNLADDLTRHFSNVQLFNQANPLIESGLKLYGNTETNTLLLQFNESSFEALLIKNNDLQYYNMFNTENADEFNYYLLGLIKELEIKHSNTKIILSGDIDSNEETYKRVRKYFNSIILADVSKLINGTTAFKDVPHHKFFSLISLNLCE